MIPKITVPVLMVLVASGCVTARATMLNPAHSYPAVSPNEVRIYTSESQLPDGCEQVALIHAEGDVESTNQSQMLNAARRRAGKVGANAVVLNEIREPTTGTRIASVVFGTPAERRGTMLALYCPPAP